MRPKLSIGYGVSGALQHTAGMIKSGLIVSIDTDPGAKIFDIANYGIVGDATTILPELIEQLKCVKKVRTYNLSLPAVLSP